MRWPKLTTLLLVFVLVIAACGDDAADETTTTAGDAGETYSFTVAVVDPDIAAVPILAAVDALVAEGHEVEVVVVAEPELAIDGLARNQFQISGETITAALLAIQKGAPITIIGDVVGNAWVLYGREDVTECADVDGARVGIFSEGAVATAMIRQWVGENCPDAKPNYLVIGGSDVRYQALVAGQIDATALDIGEGLLLDQEEGQYTVLANFSQDLNRLRPSAIYANSSFVDESPGAVQAYLEALLKQHRMINDDPGYLVELALKYLGGDAKDWQRVAEAYVEVNLFDAAAIDEASLAYTIQFFEGAGVLEPGLTVDQIANFEPLRRAEAAVGG